MSLTLDTGPRDRPDIDAQWRVYGRRLLDDKLAFGSLLFILAVLVVSAAAPWLAPYDPDEADPKLRLEGLGTPGHLFGLDDQGRDILSRILYGGRVSMLTGIVPVLVAAVLALAIGLIAGYTKSRISETIMRAIDLLFAFPMVLIAIGLATALGPGFGAVFATIVLSATPYLTRVVYANVKEERDKEYVEAARVLGASPRTVLFEEILPNVVTPIVVYGTTLVGGMIVFSAGLSFLGLGVQPPSSDWGRMVSEGAKVLTLGAPHVATVPAIVIVLVAFAFNWLGDGLRNVIDPHS